MRPYTIVRVVRLRSSPAAYDGWLVNRRPPSVGDTGALIEVLRAAGQPDRYLVECVREDGLTEWLAEFEADELEPAT